jgi:hypothetical protein
LEEPFGVSGPPSPSADARARSASSSRPFHRMARESISIGPKSYYLSRLDRYAGGYAQLGYMSGAEYGKYIQEQFADYKDFLKKHGIKE